MRFLAFTLILVALFCSGCCRIDRNIPGLAREVYSQRTWEEPLPPNEFKSDGCTAWPDGDWLQCCVEHDAFYWMGGTREQRKEADEVLRRCVAGKGYPLMGDIMYYGVRISGVYWIPKGSRWGFGWEFPQPGPPGVEY